VQQQLAEVRASRRRIVNVAVDERRRLERDLHDGAQQRMLAVGVALQLLERRLCPDHPAAAEMLKQAQGELHAAIDELRELARGIHPAILTDQGLIPAVRVLVRRIPLPVTIHDAVPDSVPLPVETAAYFVVSEALNNVVKHAWATTAAVSLARVGDRLRIEVVDDGCGGADPAKGSGLRGSPSGPRRSTVHCR
jgi:signal transduction histidine kinase